MKSTTSISVMYMYNYARTCFFYLISRRRKESEIRNKMNMASQLPLNVNKNGDNPRMSDEKVKGIVNR